MPINLVYSDARFTLGLEAVSPTAFASHNPTQMSTSRSHFSVSVPSHWRQVSFICFDLGVMNLIGGAGAAFFYSRPLFALGFAFSSFWLGIMFILIGLGAHAVQRLPSLVAVLIILADVVNTIYSLPNYDLAAGVVLVKLSFLLPLLLTLVMMLRARLGLQKPEAASAMSHSKEALALLTSMFISVGAGMTALLLFVEYAMPAITQATNPLINIFHDLVLVPALLLLFPLGAAFGEFIWMRASRFYLTVSELDLFIRYLKQMPVVSTLVEKMMQRDSKLSLTDPGRQLSWRKYVLVGSVIVIALSSGLILIRAFIATEVVTSAAPSPVDAGTLVVSQSGNGEYHSIAAAVAAAPTGAKIQVRAGVYEEVVTIEKDITLTGDEGAKIECAKGGCLRIVADRATVRNVTIRANAGFFARLFNREQKPMAVLIANGRSVIEECDISSSFGPGIVISGTGSAPEIKNSRVHNCTRNGIEFVKGSQGIVENSEIFGNTYAGVIVEKGSSALIQGSKIFDNATGVTTIGGKPIIRKSVFRSHIYSAIDVGAGSDAVIEESQIYGGQSSGIYFRDGGTGRVHNCAVFGNASSNIIVAYGSDPEISKTRMSEGGYAGLLVSDGAEVSVTECEIVNNYFGVEVRINSTLEVAASTIKNNKHQGMVADASSGGTVKGSTLTGNKDGPWKLEAGSRLMRDQNTE